MAAPASSGAPGFGSGTNSLLGPISGGSGDIIQGINQLANTSYTGTTNESETSISDEGLMYIVNSLLGSTQGLSQIAEGQANAGVYDSATNEELQDMLISNTAGVAAANDKITTGSTNTSNTGSVASGIGGLLGSISVICTYLYRKKLMSRAEYYYSIHNPPSDTIYRGYLFWALPYIRLMKRFPIFAIPMIHLMIGRNHWLQGKKTLAGAIMILLIYPISYLIGLTIKMASHIRNLNTAHEIVSN